MFLIDTDVLSALRRRERSPDVVRWISDQRTTDLYLSVVSVGEIERGIVRQRHRDPAFARVLAAWLDSVLALYGERILAVDLSTASRWGRTLGIPSPHYEIDIVDARAGGEASHAHARISRRDQAVRQCLRCRDAACKHFGFPGEADEVGVEHARSPAPLFVQGIEDGLRIDLVRAKGERLHRPAERLRFTYGGQRGQGSAERRKPAPVEAPAVTHGRPPSSGRDRHARDRPCLRAPANPAWRRRSPAAARRETRHTPRAVIRTLPIAGSQAGLPMRDQQVVTQLNEVRGLECVNDFVKIACEQLFQVRISNVSGSNQKQFARFSLQVERVHEILVFRDDDSLFSY